MEIEDLSTDGDADVTIGNNLEIDRDSPLKHLEHVQQYSDCELLDQPDEEVCILL